MTVDITQSDLDRWSDEDMMEPTPPADVPEVMSLEEIRQMIFAAQDVHGLPQSLRRRIKRLCSTATVQSAEIERLKAERAKQDKANVLLSDECTELQALNTTLEQDLSEALEAQGEGE